MTIEEIITPEVKARIEHAIAKAEAGTSCELRVHLENKCSEDALDRASFIFAELEMHRTRLRNGVLIFLALEDRKVAIVGDAGINENMEHNSWEVIKNKMISHFRDERIEEGIIEGLDLVGEKIKQFFPIKSDDRNELPNYITTGDIKKRDD